MPNVTQVIVIAAIACVGVAACGHSQPSAPQASITRSAVQANSATGAPSTAAGSATATASNGTAAPNATAGTSTTATCVGLSVCTPPPPDAQGNPPCYYRDGWEADPAGGTINVYYFRDPSNAAKPAEVTADVRLKDGTDASQIAELDAGEQVHQFQFPGIDKSTVQEVLLTTSDGRCFVIGPSGS